MVPRHSITVGSYWEGVSYERGTPVVESRIPSGHPPNHLLSSSHLSSTNLGDPIGYEPRDGFASATPQPFNPKPFNPAGVPRSKETAPPPQDHHRALGIVLT